jgi:hypothetical protein
MKHEITRTQLAEAVSKAVKKALLESTDSGVGKYAEKMDKLLADEIDGIDKLIEEGEALMKENPVHDYAIQERNHIIQTRIGILKGLKSRLVQVVEQTFRNL